MLALESSMLKSLMIFVSRDDLHQPPGQSDTNIFMKFVRILVPVGMSRLSSDSLNLLPYNQCETGSDKLFDIRDVKLKNCVFSFILILFSLHS